jgi:type II secretory pathway pseudopilin PulG
MGTISRKQCITLVEVLVVIGILGFLTLLVVAGIQRFREESRRANCTNNMKQIGLGLHNYHDARKQFPGSAQVVRANPSNPVGGWSFLFLSCWRLWGSDDNPLVSPALLKGTITTPPSCNPLVTTGDSATTPNGLAILRDTSIPEFLCPSNPNPHFENPNAPPGQGKRHAVTNYKAMCSAFYSGFVKVEQYTGTIHSTGYPGLDTCDGGLYPTNTGIRLSDLSDGTSHTILCAETMDCYASSCIAGSDVNMVAMPYTAAELQSDAANMAVSDRFNGSFWSPAGYIAKPNFYDFGQMGKCNTYFSFDFGPDGKNSCKTNANNYPLDPYQAPCQQASSRIQPDAGWRYGPSSGHPAVINCLHGDGAVRSLRKDIDAAALFFTVTRGNGDPGGGYIPLGL